MPLPQFLENSIQANGGANLLFGIIFAQKLHKNEKIELRGGTRVPRAL